MAPIDVVVHGATGKMGREVVAALSREQNMRLVGGVSKKARESHLELPDGLGTVPLSTNLLEILELTNPRVVVDFTNSGASMKAAQVVASRRIGLVIGSTGLSQENLQRLDAISKEHEVGIIVAPNFALGAVLLMHLAKQAAPYFEYVDIIEMHHEAKIDAPSGTALAIARAIAQEGKFKRNLPEKESLPGTRGGEYDGVSVHSVRMAGRSAHHEVVFGIAGETLSLRHDTLSRDCYMPGVVKAIREVVKLKTVVVGLDKLLGL